GRMRRMRGQEVAFADVGDDGSSGLGFGLDCGCFFARRVLLVATFAARRAVAPVAAITAGRAVAAITAIAPVRGAIVAPVTAIRPVATIASVASL
ncbi:MAG TPA: hypothetical protein PK264_23340, partial [Hyphomicrobiaceae bacterium]|nr:hypothetical protein [Hyphomicrobiaceae bacterium]